MNQEKLQTFLAKGASIHKDKYDYSKVVFNTIDTKVIITCPIHGDFEQTPYKHINCKRGCQKCGILKAAKTKTSSTEEFISKASVVHKGKYDYTKTVYKGAKNKATITCPEHGDFEQLASGHLSGYGCKYCASHGKGRVDMGKACTLYYLFLPDFGFYKIGITSRSLSDRYRTKFDTEQFVVLFSVSYKTGREAYDEEQRILKEFNRFKYTGPKILKTGNSEILTKDVFNGDYSKYIIPTKEQQWKLTY